MVNCVDTYYFLGIGGIGMSALARYFAAQGAHVLGYDRTVSPLTEALQAEGIQVQYDDSIEVVKKLNVNTTIVVRTPAVPEDMAIYLWLKAQGFIIMKRAEVLGKVTREARALCVAGTHGKTTTSTILAHIMHQSHLGANAFLGGIANNYQTNLLLDKQSDLVVVEADEFDRSFHYLTPYISVVTSMDADHLDIYGTEEAYCESFVHYASLVQHALVVKKNLASRLSSLTACLYTYAVGEKADFYADQVQVRDGELWFDFHTPEETIRGIRLGVPVWVNVENSVAAMAVAWLVGATDDELRYGVESFLGVYRRFNVHVNTPQVAYIDDYAHHPQELAASIQSVRMLYPDRYVIAVFQPHLFSRTRDFADGFAQVLSSVDEVLLLPIYPARELPIEGVTSEKLQRKIQDMSSTQAQCAVIDRDRIVAYIADQVKILSKPCVVLTMGAGDIDRMVLPLKQQLILNKI